MGCEGQADGAEVIWFILISTACVAIVLGAVRIILGWVLTPSALARLNSGVEAAFVLLGKILVLIAAGAIVWVIWTA